MINGTSALQQNSLVEPILIKDQLFDVVWTLDQHNKIVQKLLSYGCEYIKGREEYTLLKEVVSPNVIQVSNSGKAATPENPVISRFEGSGVNSPLCAVPL